jgi:hypothetical protein
MGEGGWTAWGAAPGWRQPPPGAEPASRPAPPDPVVGIFIVVASVLLIIAICLPWARAALDLSGLGLPPGGGGGAETIAESRAYLGVRGLPGLAALLAALAAALLGGGGAVLGRRLAAYAAIPALTVLAALALFAYGGRAEVEDALYGDALRRLPGPLGQLLRATMEITLDFGWWLSLALALVVFGAAVVGLTRRPPAPEPVDD